MADCLQEKKLPWKEQGLRDLAMISPSESSLCKSIGGIGTKGSKARAYVSAHTHRCVLEVTLEVTWKTNEKPAWKVIRREKIQSQCFLPKL